MARRAIALQPRLADAYINLAAVQTARHRHDSALQALDALLAGVRANGWDALEAEIQNEPAAGWERELASAL